MDTLDKWGMMILLILFAVIVDQASEWLEDRRRDKENAQS